MVFLIAILTIITIATAMPPLCGTTYENPPGTPMADWSPSGNAI
jgi:hypothetical protein